MPKVSDELLTLIKKQLQEHGIVVWYDPERYYTQFIEKLEIPETTILKYNGSFFQLRYQMEPFLEFVSEKGKIPDNPDIPPKLLIYVPMKREETEHALAEAEAYGVVMEPGASPWQRNTRLRVLAERVFKKIAPEEVKNILTKIDQGVLSLEELDRLAEETKDLGTLKLIFDTSNPQEIILKFLNFENFDSKIQEKRALLELSVLIKNLFGFEVSGAEDSIEKYREKLIYYLLSAEFILKLKISGDIPSALTNIYVPEAEAQQKSILELCALWRNRFDLCENYARYAEKIANYIPFDSINIPAEQLKEIETFSTIENVLLNFAETLLIEEKYQETKDLAKKRKNSFWASFREELKLHWELLEIAASLLEIADSIKKEISQIEKTRNTLLKAYVSGLNSEPWYKLERLHRRLEHKYAYIEPIINNESQLERVIFTARKKYIETASLCAEALLMVIKSEKQRYEAIDFLRQREIFRKEFYPLISQSKVAYILVDALRYEMGLELVEGLKDEFEVKIKATFCELPSITQIGMAALMPGAENGLKVVSSGRGKIGIQIEDVLLKDRSSRLKYLKDKIKEDILCLKLDELVRLKKHKKEEIKNARVIVVTSQEIDRRGEETEDEVESRIYMEDIFKKLKIAIRKLAEIGISQVLITTDHGFIFLDEVNESMKVDPPGGNTIELHSRVWIGKGGAGSPSYERFKAKDIGLESEFEFAFPKGLACFRVRGGKGGFFHGGISLPEMVIPVIKISLDKRPILSTKKKALVKLGFPKKKISKITNRFFTVSLSYTPSELFETGTQKVKVFLKHGKEIVGEPVTATYGFEEGTREITLEREKENVVTIMLEKEVEKVSIQVVDATTGVELAVIKDLDVDLTI